MKTHNLQVGSLNTATLFRPPTNHNKGIFVCLRGGIYDH